MLRATRHLLDEVPLDLSRYAKEFAEPVLAQAKHAEDWRRKEAVGAVAAIAVSCTNVDAVRDVFDAVKVRRCRLT